MNWLIYIGGGIIWYIVVAGILIVSNKGKKSKLFNRLIALAVLMVWIWICWRFI